MHKSLLVIGSVLFGIVFAVSTSRGDGEATEVSTTVDDSTEPITGTAVMPLKGSESPMKDPFTPYDIGGAAAAWKYEDLTDEEKVVAHHGLDEDQSAIQAAYADAAHALADRAKAEAAAIQLGVDSPLGALGVVP